MAEEVAFLGTVRWSTSPGMAEEVAFLGTVRWIGPDGASDSRQISAALW
jgi:hypothetical protein